MLPFTSIRLPRSTSQFKPSSESALRIEFGCDCVPEQHSKYIRSLPLSPGTGTTSDELTRESPAPPCRGEGRTPLSGSQVAPSIEVALRIRVVVVIRDSRESGTRQDLRVVQSVAALGQRNHTRRDSAAQASPCRFRWPLHIGRRIEVVVKRSVDRARVTGPLNTRVHRRSVYGRRRRGRRCKVDHSDTGITEVRSGRAAQSRCDALVQSLNSS